MLFQFSIIMPVLYVMENPRTKMGICCLRLRDHLYMITRHTDGHRSTVAWLRKKTRGTNHVTIFFNLQDSTLMGKAQKKTGKGRLDKYYKLAKYVLYIIGHLAVHWIFFAESKVIALVLPSNSFSWTKNIPFSNLPDVQLTYVLHQEDGSKWRANTCQQIVSLLVS